MTTRNIYYRTVFHRENKLKAYFLFIVASSCSMPRMLLECILRRNFGRRYFNFATAVFVFLLLMFGPLFINSMYSGSTDLLELMKEDPLWYLFAGVFLYFSYLRKREIPSKPGVFDFSKFSLCNGDRHILFEKLTFKGRNFTPRQIEIYLEPLPFFLLGILLFALFSTKLSGLLIICSILYSISYMQAYFIGDQLILDMIDEIHCNNDMRDIVKNGHSSSGIPIFFNRPGGTAPTIDRPDDPEFVNRLIDRLNNDDDDTPTGGASVAS